MPDNDAAAARLRDVRHLYSGAAALDGVTLDIPAGKMVGLIGPDGVGKSTLLALIAGARRRQSGLVEALGGDMGSSEHRRRVCARIAYMPQGLGRNLYQTLSVSENIDFFGRLFGQPAAERRERIDTLTAATGLAPFRDRPAGKLSGGMKQKLGLCCALVHDPELLILDEPTTGVDPLSRARFWDLIDAIRARRPALSVMVATAYMDEAQGFDWLAAMDGGRVLASGAPEELLAETGATSLEDAFIALLPGREKAHTERISIARRETAADPPAIAACGLTRRFGAFTAVDNVSFEIERGEIFGFLGSNGCGKTTTMKVLTGLLPASEGEATLLGRPVDGRDRETRRRVGYMSQSFSLYEELTVRQNLSLHARLYHLPAERIPERVAEMTARFELDAVADELPRRLPLGVRQRLSLAVALIHGPDVLILDEPTSGVDPVARDRFWDMLGDLSRRDGVTIFISTHFMNEAERCDRISLMHAGRVLAVGTPEELRKARGAQTLEAAFIAYLEEEAGSDEGDAPLGDRSVSAHAAGSQGEGASAGSLMRIAAFARREGLEILRDPIRLAFALIGPVILMISIGYGISFDVEDLKYAALDRDQSLESQRYLQHFEGSRYFERTAPLSDPDDLQRRLSGGEIIAAIEIPPGFGRDLLAGRAPEAAVSIDGAMPFRAEMARGYVEGVTINYGETVFAAEWPRMVEPRFRYNQAFVSVHAVAPGVIMLLLVVIPAVLTAIGVVREKELGSITNLYVTPTSRLDFLIGKQIPYVIVGFASFLSLVAMALFLFGAPLKGSPAALAVGAFVYLVATTAIGLFISAFVRSQIAALFAASILSITTAINFSGLLTPVSTLDGAAQALSAAFPAAWFHSISVGVFAKGLGFAELRAELAVLAGFAFVIIGLAALLLPRQEP